MSYKTTVLSDYPLSYYPLDDLTTGDVPDFNDLISQFDTYQDVLDFYSSYANMSGTTAFDYSGCNNIGIYSGAPETNILPIVPGNSMATKVTDSLFVSYEINNDYAGKQYTDHFATKYSSDADFTLEAWFYSKINSSNSIPILADPTNSIGIFYESGNITFKLDTKSLSYTPAELDEVLHIVAVYSVTSASLYINGEIVSTLPLNEFVFTNEECNLKSGPTPAGSYFLINSLATYRYSLSAARILAHYNEAKGLPAIQIVSENNGELFRVYDNSPSLVYKYSYPGNKNWDYFTTSDLYYDQANQTLSINYDSSAVSKTITLDDYISLPLSASMDSSKIEWRATEGIEVYTSLDGTTYTQSINGNSISGYDINTFSTDRVLHIRIVMSTTDSSKYLPRIEDLIITFYNNQILYAENSSSYISTLEEISGLPNYNITFGNDYSEILWRNSKNGVRVEENSGFNVNTQNEINTIEFFYTPEFLSNDGGLVETEDGIYNASIYRWNNTGAITKTGISALYINGVNKLSQTNINNVLKEGELHHIVIVYNGAVSGALKFNSTIYGSVPGIYQNIALYPDALTQSQVQDLYQLHIYKDYATYNSAPSASINMTENSVNYYNNDWLVVQNS